MTFAERYEKHLQERADDKEYASKLAIKALTYVASVCRVIREDIEKGRRADRDLLDQIDAMCFGAMNAIDLWETNPDGENASEN